MTASGTPAPPPEVGDTLILKPDPREGGTGMGTPCTVIKVQGHRVLVEVIVWGYVTRKRWVRANDLLEAEPD